MIFVTVGAQMPFDRLIRAMDRWAQLRDRKDIFGQIGNTDYRPEHIRFTAFMDPPEFRKKLEFADVVVAHAGMGSILTALEVGKPILVMPRRGDLKETRNDHQIATARRFLAQGRIWAAFDEEQLLERLDYLDKLQPAERISPFASPDMLAALQAFVEEREIAVSVPASRVDIPVREIESAPIRWQRRSYAWRRKQDGVRAAAADTVLRTFSTVEIQSHLRAIVLLAGRLRSADLGRRTHRSHLDLPIDADRTLLTFWRDEAADLSSAWRCHHLALRVLLDQYSPTPHVPRGTPTLDVVLERDKSEFRGTGGVLRDSCAHYQDDDWVLVANAAQLLFSSLRSLADQMAEAGGTINVVQDLEGIPNGLILIRCGVLREISDVGFHDMKEQVIPALARRHAVKVIVNTGMASRPIHSLKDFTHSLRLYHARRAANGTSDLDPPDEHWHSRFVIREPGARIAPSAILHDAVILRGAVVESGAIVIRSVVGQGALVRAGERVMDEVVARRPGEFTGHS